LESDKKLYTILAIIFLIIAVILWILYIICYISCTGTVYYVAACHANCYSSYVPWATIATTIGACALTFVLSKLESIDADIKSLQQRKQAICAAEGFGQLAQATNDAGNWVYSIGKIASTVACALGASGTVGLL
jgi:hypothetical protein